MTRPHRRVPKIKYTIPISDSEAEADESGNDLPFKFLAAEHKMKVKPRKGNAQKVRTAHTRIPKPKNEEIHTESQDLSEASTKIKKDVSVRSVKSKSDLDESKKFSFELDSVTSHDLAKEIESASLGAETSPLKPMSLDFEPFADSQVNFSNLHSEDDEADELASSKVNLIIATTVSSKFSEVNLLLL